MASGVHSYVPVPSSFGRPREDASEAKKCWSDSKSIGMMVNNSCIYTSSTLLMLEIQKKILNFRDILDLPPLNGALMIELLMGTVEDLHKLCPDFVPSRTYETYEVSTYQGLCLLYEALKVVGAAWDKKCKQSGRFHFEEVDLENITYGQLGKRVVHVLNLATTQAREFVDLMDQEGGQGGTIPSQYQQEILDNIMSPNCPFPVSPRTPTSVLPEILMPQPLNLIVELTKIHRPSPPLWPLRLEAVGKLKPIDVKRRLSFHASPQVTSQNISSSQQIGRTPVDLNLGIDNAKKSSDAPLIMGTQLPTLGDSPVDQENFDNDQLVKPDSLQEVTRKIVCSRKEGEASVDSTLPLPPSKLAVNMALGWSPLQSSDTPLLRPLPLVPEQVRTAPSPLVPPQEMAHAPCIKGSPPSPPPPPSAKGSKQLSTLSSSGPVPPPPPPPCGVTKALRAKKSTTKLKRSTQMGNLYRILKGKVEGSPLHGVPSHGRRNQIGSGSSAGKAQSMADALAEMTKRSAYFRQIEEDVEKFGPSIMEIKSAITSFQTSDMNELIKFHQHVELNLESLTDETQVLSRFEGFPVKKLDSIRMAATLYSRLEAVATNLQNWKTGVSASPLLDKVESYFNKIKEEVDAIERSKEEESKRFQSHNIHFDFNILTRIKELMVDLSSSCMEIVLTENRKQRAATIGEAASKPRSQWKMLWRTFQFAFRVYNFAGGQDDRADNLSKELAHEIETCPES